MQWRLAATIARVNICACGQEFRYNWKEMRMGEPVPVRVKTSAPAATTETFSPASR